MKINLRLTTENCADYSNLDWLTKRTQKAIDEIKEEYKKHTEKKPFCAEVVGFQKAERDIALAHKNAAAIFNAVCPGEQPFCESIHEKVIEQITEDNRKIEESVWKSMGYPNKFEGIRTLMEKAIAMKARPELPKEQQRFVDEAVGKWFSSEFDKIIADHKKFEKPFFSSHIPVPTPTKNYRDKILDLVSRAINRNITGDKKSNTEPELWPNYKDTVKIMRARLDAMNNIGKPKVPFRTEDGVDIFYEDYYVCFLSKDMNSIYERKLEERTIQGHWSSCKVFSTRKAAETYVIKNKKLFTYNEIYSVLMGVGDFRINKPSQLYDIAKVRSSLK